MVSLSLVVKNAMMKQTTPTAKQNNITLSKPFCLSPWPIDNAREVIRPE
jgi:hypothetical protein